MKRTKKREALRVKHSPDRFLGMGNCPEGMGADRLLICVASCSRKTQVKLPPSAKGDRRKTH